MSEPPRAAGGGRRASAAAASGAGTRPPRASVMCASMRALVAAAAARDGRRCASGGVGGATTRLGGLPSRHPSGRRRLPGRRRGPTRRPACGVHVDQSWLHPGRLQRAGRAIPAARCTLRYRAAACAFDRAQPHRGARPCPPLPPGDGDAAAAGREDLGAAAAGRPRVREQLRQLHRPLRRVRLLRAARCAAASLRAAAGRDYRRA